MAPEAGTPRVVLLRGHNDFVHRCRTDARVLDQAAESATSRVLLGPNGRPSIAGPPGMRRSPARPQPSCRPRWCRRFGGHWRSRKRCGCPFGWLVAHESRPHAKAVDPRRLPSRDSGWSASLSAVSCCSSHSTGFRLLARFRRASKRSFWDMRSQAGAWERPTNEVQVYAGAVQQAEPLHAVMSHHLDAESVGHQSPGSAKRLPVGRQA